MKMDTQVEVNITPVIDCLTVLLTFLLASASFLTISAFDAGYATDKVSQATAATGAPEVTIALSLLVNGLIEIKHQSQGKLNTDLVPLSALEAKLQDLRSKSTQDTVVSLDADPAVSYSKVIETMDQIKQKFPQVVMGGIE